MFIVHNFCINLNVPIYKNSNDSIISIILNWYFHVSRCPFPKINGFAHSLKLYTYPTYSSFVHFGVVKY